MLLYVLFLFVHIRHAQSGETCPSPEQIHLSLGDTPSEMVVMWATADKVKCWVTYSKVDSTQEYRTYSTISQLTQQSDSALRNIHRATLKGLDENSLYQYTVTASCHGSTSTSQVYNFTTLSSNQTEPVSMLMYGDMGVISNLSHHIVLLSSEIQQHKHQLIWHIGDFAYDLHTNGGKMGDDFLREIETIAASLPYMTAPGNHEIPDDFHHYRMRFSQPNTVWPIPLESMAYSYDIGPVHFISYSTEVYFTSDQNYVSRQFYWLLKDLVRANKNRHIRPWIVVMGHRPLYCSNDDKDDCTNKWFSGWVRHGVEDLFYAQGVDLIVQGHEHSYERTLPMYKDKPVSDNYTDPRAPVHIITGAAGCREGLDPFFKATRSWSAATNVKNPNKNSYGRLQVWNETHLQWEQIAFDTQTVIDSVWIVQTAHGPFDKNVDCDESGGGSHPSCRCPFVFHYITLQIALPTVLILAVIGVTLGICRWIRKKKAKTTVKEECLLDNQEDFDFE